MRSCSFLKNAASKASLTHELRKSRLRGSTAAWKTGGSEAFPLTNNERVGDAFREARLEGMVEWVEPKLATDASKDDYHPNPFPSPMEREAGT